MKYKAVFGLISVLLSINAYSKNIDPTTEKGYVEVMLECYTENIPANEKWKSIKFSYARGGVDNEGKSKVKVTAKYSKDDINWEIAPSCHPLAPMVITENYLKNIKKFNKGFKSIQLVAHDSGSFNVDIKQK